MITTRVHGVIDYLTGLILIVAPFILDFADGSAAQWVPILLGATTIAMSLITHYELSIAKVIPLNVHLAIDVATGSLLAASPWLFGFADRIWWPHVLVGVMEILVPLITRRRPDARSA
jgi:hypothetical protein